jgi:hypothetical protein
MLAANPCCWTPSQPENTNMCVHAYLELRHEPHFGRYNTNARTHARMHSNSR